MCGIVGAVAQRNAVPILIEGLKRLEYRGYDSAGLVVVGPNGLERRRAVGKVAELEAKCAAEPASGGLGIAHTRWATHGGVTEVNAHPHVSTGRVAVVHNGIIENHEPLRAELRAAGYEIESDTDTEVISHLVHRELLEDGDLASAVQRSVARLKGAYGIAVIDIQSADRMVVARMGSPLVLGVGVNEHFAASDIAALLPVTQRFIFLEDGDVATLGQTELKILDCEGKPVEREVHESALKAEASEKGNYRHYMAKEIFEQPKALAATLQGRITPDAVLPEILGPKAKDLLPQVKSIHIIACGTSYHAGLVGKYWIEGVAGLPVQVEIASEYRYRKIVVPPGCLLITLSQSGETADTLEALRLAKVSGYLATLTICNTGYSSMVRESDLALITQAGPEIGVASTKAFTTQLISMLLVALMLGRNNGLPKERESEIVKQLNSAPRKLEEVLQMDGAIRKLAEQFVDRHHTLFLGRGPMWPIAMEGALKLKEISYIHAEAYAAGELKHGPLALIDEDMPVVVVAPNDELLDKLKSNMEVVRARGGKLFVFADSEIGLHAEGGYTVFGMPSMHDLIAPIVYTVPLQLLSYHVAVLKGTDVDQPRNLAKSVTVE